jgi:hypothetical protein
MGRAYSLFKEVKMSKWVAKGKNFRPIGAVWSNNPEKAERTIKRMSSSQKRAFGRAAAKKYKSRY